MRVDYSTVPVDSVNCKIPVGTQRENDVSTSMRRDHVASTLIRRHFFCCCVPAGMDVTPMI